MALNGLYCADVPLSNYSLTHHIFDIEVKPAGFFVCLERPWLGASPDSVIDDLKFLESRGSETVLKQHSKYLCQVQGQLFVTGQRVCKFFVYTFVDMFVQEIEIDIEYCKQSLLPKLDTFYTKYFRKYVAKSLE